MSRGIIRTMQLAATLVFAIPIAMFGLDFLRQGEVLIGGTAVAVAVLMVLIEEYLTTPGDLPETVLETVTSRLDGRDDE